MKVQLQVSRRKEEFVLGSVWSSQTQTGQTRDSLEVREQHLDFLPLGFSALSLKKLDGADHRPQ